MIEHLHADTAWRSYFLVILIATAVVFLIYLFRVLYLSHLSIWALLRLKDREQRRLNPTRSKISQILLRLDIPSFLWCSIAMVCLQLAFYFGPSQSWNTALVISLLTAGFGLSFAMFILDQFRRPQLEAELPAIIPFRMLKSGAILKALCTALWGFSYHSFSHLIRKFKPFNCPI
jgi:MFS family permease